MIRTFVRLLIAVQFSLLAPRIVYSHGPQVQRPQARPSISSVVRLAEKGIERFSALAPWSRRTTDARPLTMYHEEALEAGCDACLAKPFKLAELSAAIRRASHRGR